MGPSVCIWMRETRALESRSKHVAANSFRVKRLKAQDDLTESQTAASLSLGVLRWTISAPITASRSWQTCFYASGSLLGHPSDTCSIFTGPSVQQNLENWLKPLEVTRKQALSGASKHSSPSQKVRGLGPCLWAFWAFWNRLDETS